jgi:hypothetical protein
MLVNRQSLQGGRALGRYKQFMPQQLGLQVSRGVDTEISAKGDVSKIAQGSWRDFHELARRKECKILEGHVAVDHVHMYISIPPKYAVAHSQILSE